MSLLRPVVGPVIPKFAYRDTRQGLKRLTAVGGNRPPRSPVDEGLDALPEGVCGLGNAAKFFHGKIEGFCVHGRIVHEPCSGGQQNVLGDFDTPGMEPAKDRDPVWERVAAELERRGKGLQWLATKLDISIQRVQNWTTRGLPGKSYADVAQALDESTDWLVGLSEPKWKSPKEPPTDRDKLSPAGVAVGKAFDSMNPTQQERFLKLLEVAFGDAAPAPRPPELGNSDVMDLELDTTDQDQLKGKTRGTGS